MKPEDRVLPACFSPPLGRWSPFYSRGRRTPLVLELPPRDFLKHDLYQPVKCSLRLNHGWHSLIA